MSVAAMIPRFAADAHAWLCFAMLLGACGGPEPVDAAHDAGIDSVYVAPDVTMHMNDACHPLPMNLPTPTVSCVPADPTGGACAMHCAVCLPDGSAGFPCVCNGTAWVCPTNEGCQVGKMEEPVWNGGAPPTSCP